jgi:hypothetical protein
VDDVQARAYERLLGPDWKNELDLADEREANWPEEWKE